VASTSEKISPAVHRSKAKRRWPKRPALIRALYKSRLEDRIAQQLEAAELPFHYEGERLAYYVPARAAKYTPDFRIGSIYIEAKGWLKPEDRLKLRLIKEAHPEMDLRLVFQRASAPIYKDSPTTYAKWCDDHGFPWADKGTIPTEWINEARKQQ
jgi:hypothetical protein